MSFVGEVISRIGMVRRPPRGVNFLWDIGLLKNLRVENIFDVGANTGQSAREYLTRFPSARVFSFEPVESSYRELVKSQGANRRFSAHRIAFGASAGQARMTVDGSSDLARFSEDGTEVVNVETLDGFCTQHAVERIDLLKVDTEGHDLEVLEGARSMLSDQRIQLVQVEAGMNPDNRLHVPFEALKAFLEKQGYLLFGVYEQALEWPSREPQLRRSNPVFISRRAVAENSPCF
jgi:FkbM family methyltransferase